MRASLDQKNIYLYLISVYISHIIFQLQRLVRLIWDYIETIYETISLKVICDVWSIIYILDMNRYDIFAIFNIFGPWRELIVRNSTPCSPAASAVLLTTHSMEEAEAAMSNFEGEKWFDNLTIWQFDCTWLVVTGGCFRSLWKYRRRFTLQRHNKKAQNWFRCQ